MSNFVYVKKCVQIKANLSTETLTYKPYPSNEFNNSYKFIAIESVAYYANEDIDNICTLSCNFVKSQAYNERNEVSSFEQPLKSFLINSRKFQQKNFNIVWYLINSVSEELKFTVRNFRGQKVEKNVEVAITVAFF